MEIRNGGASDLMCYEPRTVYHYCSLEALFGILSSKSLWLTALESTNDGKELKFGSSLMVQTLNHMISNETDEEIRIILQDILDAPRKREYKKLTRKRYFGTSFVDKKDSLTHWDRYGSGGKGVSIAIDIGRLEHFFLIRTIPDICTRWIWHHKILYSHEEQCNYVENHMRSQIDGFSKIAKGFADPRLSQVLHYNTLTAITPIAKHDGFADENEYRLIFEEGQGEDTASFFARIANSTDDPNFFLDMSERLNETVAHLCLGKMDIKHSIIGGLIRSYYALNLSPMWGSLLVPEVIIGPKCYQNIKEIKSFLNANGLADTKVGVSQIPIR